MSDAQSIQNELTAIDAAMADVSSSMERLKLTWPAKDDERDAKRDELHAARVRYAILRTQAASNQIDASALVNGLADVEELEISLASDEEQEAAFIYLNDLHALLVQQRNEAYARLGRATYAGLRYDLSQLAERADKAQHAADEAKEAERAARVNLASKLTNWPALAQDARARYASEKQPEPAERVLAAQIALWDAMEAAQGKVGTVVNEVNIMRFFDMTSEKADAVLHRNIGRVVDERTRAQALGLLAALRSMRNA